MKRRARHDTIGEAEMRFNAIDPEIVKQLMEDGLSYPEALRIAATEMNGTTEDEEGNVWGTQTYCDALNPKKFRRRFRGRERE